MNGQDPIEAFRIEAGELLEATEQALLDLSHDLTSRELIDTVFRGMHTLKGSGAMFGFDALAAFTHHCETAFDKVRKGQARASAELVALTLSAMDHMRTLIDQPNGDGVDNESADLLAGLQALLDGEGAAAVVDCRDDAAHDTTERADTGLGQGWHLHFRLPANALATGTNPLLLLDELRELGATNVAAEFDAVPPLDELDPTQCLMGWSMDLPASANREVIEDVFLFVLDDMELSITPIAGSNDEVGATAEDGPSDTAVAVVPSPLPHATVGSAEVASAEPASAKAARGPSESVRVPAERLDLLMDRVGELVIVQSRLAQLAGNGISGPAGELALRSISEEVERLANELRDTMMVLRMVPIASLFGRFRRLVHDLARETGKSIDLTTDGESTEIDKTVSERLADPIVHLIRNACDHGLETEEERLAAGKAASGRIRLSAQQAGGEVLITIEDDAAASAANASAPRRRPMA